MIKIGKKIEAVSNFGGYISGVLVIALMSIVVYEAFMRYAFGRAPGIADEISGYMLIAIGFLGLAYTWKEKGHVRVEAMTSRISPGVAKWFRFVTLLIALGFIGLATKVSYTTLIDVNNRHLYSMTQLRIYMLWPMLPLAIGFGMLLLQLSVEVYKNVKALRAGEEQI